MDNSITIEKNIDILSDEASKGNGIASNSRIKEINFHITDYCEGHCPMCYATDEKMIRKHGDIETLKLVVHNAIAYGRVERFVMVGGDPCEHPNLVELLKYIKQEGKKYDIDTKSMVISNTHEYKEKGEKINIEDINDYLDGVCLTVHGHTSSIHDKFNGCLGSYNKVMENLRRYAKVKNKNQEICIIVNLMPSTIEHLWDLVNNTNNELNGKIDSIAIQRIAPIGKACGTKKYFIDTKDVNQILKTFKEIQEKYGFYLEFVDAFPWCIVKQEYRNLLHKGGCNWGTDYCAVFSDGSVSRCAMSENKLSMNMTQLDTREKFEDFWKYDKELTRFRKKEHIDEKCKNCELLDDCGGGCALARMTGDPYKREEVEKGHDYLIKR